MSAAVRPKLHPIMPNDLDTNCINKGSTFAARVKKKIPSTLPNRPPGSQSSARSLSRHSSLLTSARSTTSARRGSAKDRGERLKDRQRVKENATHEVEEEEDGIRFINVPSETSHTKQGAKPKEIRPITQKDILASAQETECSRVYEIDLHASHVAVIENLEKFTKLKVLDLSCNYIKYIDNLDHNQDLRELKLYDNCLTDIANLDKLKELNTLQLQHNQIGKLGKGLQTLRRLKILRLDSNLLTKLDVREITALGQLTSLDISNNRLDNIGPVNCLPALEELYARNNRLRVVSDLSRCKKLQEIDLSQNKLSDLSGLKNLPHVTVIHITNNQLVSLKSLGKLKSLHEIFASHNRLSELGCVAGNHPGLQILDVSDNHIENWQELCSLEQFTELVELYVSGNPFSLPGGAKSNYIPDLHAALPQIQVLDGVQVVKPSSRPGTPLMRPMSASSIVSARQVEAQIKNMNVELSNFELDLSRRFDSLRQTMDSLPSQAPASGLSSSPTPRPFSRSGKRSRLKQAMEFAAVVDREDTEDYF